MFYVAGAEEWTKEHIVREAGKGTFNHSPLLTMPHTITCGNCRQTLRIVYLDYLKEGRFRIAKPQTVETESLLGAFMAIEEEKVTVLVFDLNCEHCGGSLEVRPFTVEYLHTIGNKSSPSGMMWA